MQLSGIVQTGGDEKAGLRGAAVYVPHTTRGTHTSEGGYFSMPVLAGDSVVISMLGYGKQYVLIPEDISTHSYATTVTLQEQATELPTVDVMPWATERDLRAAIAKVKLPATHTPKVNVGEVPGEYATDGPAMDSEASAAHGLQQQQMQQQKRILVPSDVKLFSIPIRYK